MVFGSELYRLESEKELLYSPIGEAKTNYLIGNYELAAKHVFQWYDDRVDYLTEKGSPSRDSVYEGERRELADAMNHHYEAIKANRNENIPWYDDPMAKEIWSVASEAADVAIVMASELKNEGADQNWIVGLWKGAYDQENFFGRLNDYRSHIRSIRENLASIGVDLAEAIVMKSALNEQHYPKEFWPWVMIQDIGNGEDLATFAKRFRKEVGPRGISQMFDLSMTPIGETNLSRAERSPFGSNGSSPKAIYVRENGKIELAPSDMDHTHGGLYVVGAIHWLCDDYEHRFAHDATRADYRWYFSQPRWRELLDKFNQSGIKELVVPSGSHFRFEGLRSLAKYIEKGFENLGEVEADLLKH